MENIETKRLIIRRFQETDWNDLYEYLSDPKVIKFEPYEVYTEEQAKKEAINRASMDSFFAVCLKSDNKLIGNIYFAKEEFDNWELGYVFNSNFQGNGYATEASRAIVSKAFKDWNARRVIGMCNPLNTKSWHLLERLGLRREGTLIKNIYFKYDNSGNPIWADTYEYGILKSEWNVLN